MREEKFSFLSRVVIVESSNVLKWGLWASVRQAEFFGRIGKFTNIIGTVCQVQ